MSRYTGPSAVIVMTLARVGSGEGPGSANASPRSSPAPDGRRVYAAGGVRHRADIEALHAAGAAGVLIATALHAGTIKAGDLRRSPAFDVVARRVRAEPHAGGSTRSNGRKAVYPIAAADPPS